MALSGSVPGFVYYTLVSNYLAYRGGRWGSLGLDPHGGREREGGTGWAIGEGGSGGRRAGREAGRS